MPDIFTAAEGRRYVTEYQVKWGQFFFLKKRELSPFRILLEGV